MPATSPDGRLSQIRMDLEKWQLTTTHAKYQLFFWTTAELRPHFWRRIVFDTARQEAYTRRSYLFSNNFCYFFSCGGCHRCHHQPDREACPVRAPCDDSGIGPHSNCWRTAVFWRCAAREGTDTDQPWCRDPDFDSDGQALITDTTGVDLEEARAVAIQTVLNDEEVPEERTLLGGWGKYQPEPPGFGGGPPNGYDLSHPNYVIARLCPDGSPDQNGNCSASGFGPDGDGVVMFDFWYNNTTDSQKPPRMEVINAIAIQQAESEACDDTEPTDKIIVAGTVDTRTEGEHNMPTQFVWGLVRFCADGRVDTDWGGNFRDWNDPNYIGDEYDDLGTVTISFGVPGQQQPIHWTKRGEAFALAVQEDGKIVVGGFSDINPNPETHPEAVPFRYFALARLDTDDNCGAGNWGCYDTTFGPSADVDPGRIWFDRDGSTTGDGTVDMVRGLQLIDNGNDTFDILITGPVATTHGDRDFWAARIAADGDASGGDPRVWSKNVIFRNPNMTHRDDIALDVAYNAPDMQLVIAGVTCDASAPCVVGASQGQTPDVSPSSNIAFALLDATDGDIVYQRQVTGGTGELGDTHTDVAHSVVLQPDADNPENPPWIIVGGYSVDSDNDPPYMSGARFEYNTPDPDDYAFLRSDLSGAGANGDQAWELWIQPSNERIVVGGFHARILTKPMAVWMRAVRRRPAAVEVSL
jgi:hypothetical protein